MADALRKVVTPIAVVERMLPHNLQAEKAVLGAILVHNDAFEHVSGLLTGATFFRQAHARIYRAIEGLLEWEGGSVDLVTLQAALRKSGDLEEVGGPAYLASLTDGVPRSMNVGHYAELVKEAGRLRGLIAAADRMLTAAYEAEEPAASILLQADLALIDLQTDHGPSQMRPLTETLPALWDNLEWRQQHRGEVVGVPTGFASLNELTMGWQAGDLIVIGARPSIGKTAFMLNAVTAAAAAGKRSAVFSLEMRQQQLEYRMLSSLSGVPLSRLLSGNMMSPDWGPLSMARETMAGWPILINDHAGQGVADIRSACRRARAEHGLDLVAIDYVQLMAGATARKGATRNEEITDISRRLKVLADELRVPILLLSQLSRANEKRNDPRPKLSDLRESGALEQDADIVLFLHRRNHREGGTTNAIFEKQRNGPTGTLNLTLDRDIVTFTDGGEDPPPPAPSKPRKTREHSRTGEDD